MRLKTRLGRFVSHCLSLPLFMQFVNLAACIYVCKHVLVLPLWIITGNSEDRLSHIKWFDAFTGNTCANHFLLQFLLI